ncbi:MAG: hypothetical protein SF187_17195 [Deltaproteobacteria bacterium]|nr:hypothetical protein [Deltaproteobacteria bacterium]
MRPKTNRAGEQAERQARVGRLVAVDERGTAWVDFDDGGGRPVAATLGFTASREQLEHVMNVKAPVVAYTDEAGTQLVAVVGVALTAPTSPQVASTASPFVEADVDGQRVRVQAEHEVVIACGKASITLRANGRVIIKGTQIESNSEGTNRIKGGQVRIN